MEVSYTFAIKPIIDCDEHDASQALAIYDNRTPVEIKTNRRDFSYHLANKSNEFDMYLFSLHYNDKVIGMAMATHVDNLLIFDYLALEEQYEGVNSLYFSYIDLITKYIKEKAIEKQKSIDYYITEINANKNGTDKETKRFTRVFCLYGYGAITFLYQTLPLGEAKGTTFDTYLYIKTNQKISFIDKEVYLSIIRSIYMNYYCAWYRGILDNTPYEQYVDNANRLYNDIKDKLENEKNLPVVMPTCQYTDCSEGFFHSAQVLVPKITESRKGLFSIIKFFFFLSVILFFISLVSLVISLFGGEYREFQIYFSSVTGLVSALLSIYAKENVSKS